MFGEGDTNKKVYDSVVKSNAREISEVENLLKSFPKKSLQRLVMTSLGLKEYKLTQQEEGLIIRMLKVQESIFGAIALQQKDKGE